MYNTLLTEIAEIYPLQCYTPLMNKVIGFVKDYRSDCPLKYSPPGVGAYAETVGSAGMVLARHGFFSSPD